jgi:hypothetical protein
MSFSFSIFVSPAGSTTTVQPSSRRSSYAGIASGPTVALYSAAAPQCACRARNSSAGDGSDAHDMRHLRSVERRRRVRAPQGNLAPVRLPDGKGRMGEEPGGRKDLHPATSLRPVVALSSQVRMLAIISGRSLARALPARTASCRACAVTPALKNPAES